MKNSTLAAGTVVTIALSLCGVVYALWNVRVDKVQAVGEQNTKEIAEFKEQYARDMAEVKTDVKWIRSALEKRK